MPTPEEVFPNITKLKLARDLCFFLDWAREIRGAQFTERTTGELIDNIALIAEYVVIDHAKLAEESLHLEQMILQEEQSGGRVN